jgi:hypothetical protein
VDSQKELRKSSIIDAIEIEKLELRVKAGDTTAEHAMDHKRESVLAAKPDAIVAYQPSLSDQIGQLQKILDRANDPAADEEKVARLRQVLQLMAVTEASIVEELTALIPAAAKSSRSSYLRSLPEVLGDKPKHSWQSEWAAMIFELKKCEGSLKQEPNGQWTAIQEFRWGSCNVITGDVIDEAWVSENESIEVLSDRGRCQNPWVVRLIERTVASGWSLDDAQAITLLTTARSSITRALIERDMCYAASTYKLCELIASKAAEQARNQLCAPTLYRVMSGFVGSLADQDPGWTNIETPDATGFCGLCSLHMVKADAAPHRFTPGGMTLFDALLGMTVRASPVVAFESESEDEHGYHAATMQDMKHITGIFPPICLYRLKRVEPDGFFAPGGVYVKQKLLVVTATYRSPVPQSMQTASGGKMCGTVVTLAYGDRTVFVDGFDALVADKAPLTMAMEFDRAQSWTDWRGVAYNLRGEWAYASGPALRCSGCTPGIRDDNNDGMGVDGFCERVREYVATRRDLGCGLKMPAEAAYLTREEVLAIRLYSGPCYGPINTFLRQVAACTGKHRHALATHPLYSFAATCRHLTSAVRKLAAVATAEESTAPLWRGVRGELKSSFWAKDEQGLVCAVDTAFMSTSRRRDTPIEYMDSLGPNVLWELHPRIESDTAYHYGADISMLSQFAAEAEVVFPPCTMLVVRDPSKYEGDGGGQKQKPPEPKWVEEGGQRFLPVAVQPAFV